MKHKHIQLIATVLIAAFALQPACQTGRDLAWGYTKGAAAHTAVWTARPLSPSAGERKGSMVDGLWPVPYGEVSLRSAVDCGLLTVDYMLRPRAAEEREKLILLTRDKGYDLPDVVKHYREALKNIFSSQEVKTNAQAGREAYYGRQRNISDFNGKCMVIDWDKVVIPNGSGGFFAHLVFYTQRLRLFCGKNGIVRTGINIGVNPDFQYFNRNNRAGNTFMDFIRESYRTTSAHKKSRDLGTRKNSGIPPYLDFAFWTIWRGVPSASVYTNPLPSTITTYRPPYFVTRYSKFLLNQTSASITFCFLCSIAYSFLPVKDNTGLLKSQGLAAAIKFSVLRPRAMDERDLARPPKEEIIERIKHEPNTLERLRAAMQWYGVGSPFCSVRSFAGKIGVKYETVNGILQGATTRYVIRKTAKAIALGVGLPVEIFYIEGKTPPEEPLVDYQRLEDRIFRILHEKGPISSYEIAKALKTHEGWKLDYMYIHLRRLRTMVNEAIVGNPAFSEFKPRRPAQISEISIEAASYYAPARKYQERDEKGNFVSILKRRHRISLQSIIYVMHRCRWTMLIANKEPDKEIVVEIINEAGRVFEAFREELAERFLKVKNIAERERIAQAVLADEIKLIREYFIGDLGSLDNLTSGDYDDICTELDFYRSMLLDLVVSPISELERYSKTLLQQVVTIAGSLNTIENTFLEELQNAPALREEKPNEKTYRQTLGSVLRPRAAGERDMEFPPLTSEQEQQILGHKSIGWRLLEVLAIRDMQQLELSKKIGSSVVGINHIITNRRVPSYRLLGRIAAVLNVNVEIFISEAVPIIAPSIPIPDDALAQILAKPTPGGRFKALRIYRGFSSSSELAERSNLTHSTIDGIESSARTSLRRQTALSLERALPVEENLLRRMGFNIKGSEDKNKRKVIVPETDTPATADSGYVQILEKLESAKTPLSAKDIAAALGLSSRAVSKIIRQHEELLCHDAYKPVARVEGLALPLDLMKAREILALAPRAYVKGFYDQAMMLCRRAIDLSEGITSERSDINVIRAETIEEAQALLATFEEKDKEVKPTIKKAAVSETLEAELDLITKWSAKKGSISLKAFQSIQRRLEACCGVIIDAAEEEGSSAAAVELLSKKLQEEVNEFLSTLRARFKIQPPRPVSPPDDKSILTSILRPRAVGERGTGEVRMPEYRNIVPVVNMSSEQIRAVSLKYCENPKKGVSPYANLAAERNGVAELKRYLDYVISGDQIPFNPTLKDAEVLIIGDAHGTDLIRFLTLFPKIRTIHMLDALELWEADKVLTEFKKEHNIKTEIRGYRMNAMELPRGLMGKISIVFDSGVFDSTAFSPEQLLQARLEIERILRARGIYITNLAAEDFPYHLRRTEDPMVEISPPSMRDIPAFYSRRNKAQEEFRVYQKWPKGAKVTPYLGGKVKQWYLRNHEESQHSILRPQAAGEGGGK